MNLHLRKKNLALGFIIFLILSLSHTSAVISAESKVIELYKQYVPYLAETETHLILDGIRKRFQRSGYKVKVFEDYDSQSDSNRVRSSLRKIQNLQAQFKNKKAYQNIKKDLNTLDLDTLHSEELYYLPELYVLRSYLAKNYSLHKESKKFIQKALHLNPSLEASSLNYPPSFTNHFIQIKKEFWNKNNFGSLDIRSSKKRSSVYINGQLKGQTPLSISHFPYGKHLIHIQKDKKFISHLIEIKTNETLQVYLKPKNKILLQNNNLISSNKNLTTNLSNQNPNKIKIFLSVIKRKSDFLLQLHSSYKEEFQYNFDFNSNDSLDYSSRLAFEKIKEKIN